MINGTFRAWVDDGCGGIFSSQDEVGRQMTVQIAEYEPGDQFYEVTCDCPPGGAMRYEQADDIVEDGHVLWNTHGDVTDG